ncbi:cell wall mannoprotein 1 family protein [Aspergillus candidus]|uniref:Cell wall protein n=1 Tax=Aspergillus candidus TaxID=41067 RepID=A0A2I2F0R5_ASPCN|nr:hypothetical protein BDW47DRAFT_120517 [Aspergillus candidus]PLB34220.1 hypothetical protein BDW47DRAFT_120517 [Aspergillus candidus]
MVLSMAVSSSAFLLAAPLFLTSTLAGAALASTDPADPFSNLLDNLAQAASDYVVFKQAVDSFNGDRNTIRSLAEFGLIVEQSVNNSTATAKACHKLNANESTEVMTALAKPYPTFMADLLGNITAKKPYVDELRMNSQVVGYLRRMFRASDQLPLALEKIAVESDARVIDQGRLWCNGLIRDAIDEFGK